MMNDGWLENRCKINILFAVMDAWGKTPSGIFSGNSVSMGDFDQCIAVKHEIASSNEFEGQYCIMEVLVNITAMNKPENKISPDISRLSLLHTQQILQL